MHRRKAETHALEPFVAAACAAVAALIGAVDAHSLPRTVPTLYVKYGGTSCTFTLTDDSGQGVVSIPAGTYQVLVSTPVVFNDVDLQTYTGLTGCTTYVRFQLDGPGVALKTTLTAGDEDQASFNATLQPGSTYVAIDLNNPAARVVFTTGPATAGAGASTANTTTTSAPGSTQPSLVGSAAASSQGTLRAVIHQNGVLTLTRAGNSVSSLPTGRWTLLVRDMSGKSGLSLQKGSIKAETITTAAFAGSRTLTLTLEPGRWRFLSSPGKSAVTFVVTSQS
jgi:hypothetical protein